MRSLTSAAAAAVAASLVLLPSSRASPTSSSLHLPGLSLRDFQRALRTNLGEELGLISAGYDDRPCEGCRGVEPRANVRRRDAPPSSSDWSHPREPVLGQLLDRAWSVAESVGRREDGRLILIDDADDELLLRRLPCPFLICSTGAREASSILDESQSLSWAPSDLGGNCIVLTNTAAWARRAAASAGDLVVQPLIDVMKIQPGTIDRVISPAWRVPFTKDEDLRTTKNITEASFKYWERTLSVALAPGLETKDEAGMMDLIEIIIHDLHGMGEVGWAARQVNDKVRGGKGAMHLRSLSKLEARRRQYLEDNGLVGVPSLSSLFSLTSSKYGQDTEENNPAAYWDTSFANGLESSHACESLFDMVSADPQPSKSAFDLVLNPEGAWPPKDYESSASNVDCVTSLIVGLSLHPFVMSVKSNVPEYNGWAAVVSDSA